MRSRRILGSKSLIVVRYIWAYVADILVVIICCVTPIRTRSKSSSIVGDDMSFYPASHAKWARNCSDLTCSSKTCGYW